MALSALETLEVLASLGLALVDIPSGSFLMGSDKNDPDHYSDEAPLHAVSVPACQISRTLVTQAQWRWVAQNLPKVRIELKPAPSYFKGDNRPVETVSHDEAIEFCERLSAATQKKFNLPAEAQWEYACRAGTDTPYYCGHKLTPKDANYSGSGISGTMDVGMFPANAWGLHDMHGNVWEWCLDHWHDSYKGAPSNCSAWLTPSASEGETRLLRGGSWSGVPRFCRSAARSHDWPGYAYNDVGFRVVCLP